MKILISGLDSGGPGGAENFLLSLSLELIKQEIMVDYIGVKGSYLSNQFKKNGFYCYYLNPRPDIIGNWRGFIKFLIFYPYYLLKNLSILHNFSMRGGEFVLMSGVSDKILISCLSSFFNLKAVWIEFSSPKDYLDKCPLFVKYLYNYSRRFAGMTITPTKANFVKLINAGFRKTNLRVIPCGIKIFDTKKIKEYKKKSLDLKKRLRLDNKFVIGSVSRIQDEKGQDELIKSLSYLKDDIDKIHLILAGYGDNQKLVFLADKLHLKNKITFMGEVKDIYDVISIFDVFVFPTRWKLEGFGLVAIEAMMIGVPVIAGDVPSLREVVDDAGIVCKPYAKDLSRAIFKLYKNSSLKTDLINKGISRSKYFNINDIATEYIRILEKIR